MSEIVSSDEIIPNGEQVVERFGGIRPMASKLGIPVTTVQGWKKRDAIPAARWDEIVSAAGLYDIDLDDLAQAPSANENTQQSAPKNTGIADDPALATNAPKAQAAPKQQNAGPRKRAARMDDDIIGLDISQLRRTARTTSLVTSGIVSVLVFAAGWMLFSGESAQQSAPHDQSDFKQISQKVESTSNGFEAMRARMQVLQNSVGKLSEAMGNLDGETPFSVRLTMLENQIRQMGGTKLADLASRLQAQVDNPIGNTEWLSAIEQLRSVVMGVQNRTERLEDALGRAQGHNDALGRTLSDLSGRDLSAAAMLLALTQLRSSAEREAPFADDLTLLRTLTAQSDPALAASIDKLGPYAEKGVLSPTGLKRALLASANDIVTAKMRGEDVSIKDKVMGRLSGLFSIKQDGVPVNGSAEQALIQKAISQLDQNDVAGASATLAQLKGPAAAAAAPWQQEAQANLMVEALDGQLVNTLMQRLKSGLTRTRVINLAPRAQATAPSTPVLTNPDMPSMPAPLPATEPQAGQPQELPEMLPPDDGMQEVPGGDIMIQQ